MFYLIFYFIFKKKYFLFIYGILFTFFIGFFGFGANSLPSGGNMPEYINVNNEKEKIKFQHYKINNITYFVPYYIQKATDGTNNVNINLFLTNNNESLELESMIKNEMIMQK